MGTGEVDGGLDDVRDAAGSEVRHLVSFGLFKTREREDVFDERVKPNRLVRQHFLELRSVLSVEAATILKVTRRLRKGGQTFSEPSLAVLLDVHDRTRSFAALVSSYLKSPRPSFDLGAVQARSKELHDLVRTSRHGQLNRVGPNDSNSPIRVLVELDILNAYERVRAYYLNVAETLAGGK